MPGIIDGEPGIFVQFILWTLEKLGLFKDAEEEPMDPELRKLLKDKGFHFTDEE